MPDDTRNVKSGVNGGIFKNIFCDFLNARNAQHFTYPFPDSDVWTDKSVFLSQLK